MDKNTKINIKGETWAIKYVPSDSDKLDGNDGICDTKLKTIYLSKTPTRSKTSVYWHEYFHAYLWESGVRDLDGHFEHVLIEIMSDLMEKRNETPNKSRANSSRRKR